jgi:hypothetical protein
MIAVPAMYKKNLELNRQIEIERDSGKISALLQQLRKEIALERDRIETVQLSKLKRVPELN